MGQYYTCDISFIFNLNESKCTHCMSCVNECSYNALHFENNEFLIEPDKCSRCETCAAVCPTNAITIKFEMGEIKNVIEKPNQKIFVTNLKSK